MYTWNTLPAMQRGGFSAMLWSASWSRTCCKFLLTLQSFGRFITAPPFSSNVCRAHAHSTQIPACKPEYRKHTLHFCCLQMPCSKWRPFPCQNLCGNPLLCGNHYCTKSCHVLEVPLKQIEGDPIASVNKENALAEPCEQCNLNCQRVRYSLFLFKNFCFVCFTKLNMKKLLRFHMLLSLVLDIDYKYLFQVR